MKFELLIVTSEGADVIGNINFTSSEEQHFTHKTFNITVEKILKGSCYIAEITAKGKGEAYIAVRGVYDRGEVYTFSGEKDAFGVFRQSPHNLKEYVIDTPKEAVPMVALCKDGVFTVLISDNPAMYNNYSTQTVNPEEKYIEIASGDSGITTGGSLEFKPYYHSAENTIKFTAVLFNTNAKDLNSLRKDVFYAIGTAFGSEKNSKFYSICFSSNYMHYRANESGSSKCWVVPGIEYSNYQYPRDAFWQSMIFPPEMEKECYDGVYKGRYTYAENALIFIIWSYRIFKNGGKPDMERFYDALSYIKKFAKDGYYFAGDTGNYDFKSWYDICSFENDDVLAYNQGLYAAALVAADKMGIETGLDAELAIQRYNELFVEEKGYFPLSKKKPQALSLDPTVGDLLSYVFMDKKLLDDDKVKSHYKKTFAAAKTQFGSKVTCAENGDFLTLEDFSAYGKVNKELATHTPGYYSWGGSYYIYEMLFHMAAYIHGAVDAEDNMIWRSGIDFKIGGTYFEHINTVTGEGNKANQGWNCCVYPIWQSFIDKGIATDRFFKEMEKLL